MPASNFKDFGAGNVLAADADMDALQTWIRQNFIAKDSSSEPLDNNAYLKAENAAGTAYNTVGIDGDNVMQIGDSSLISKVNGVPAAGAYHDVDQTIPHNTSTAVALNTDFFDNSPGGTMHDTATNNNRLVAPVAGKYLVVGIISITPTAAGHIEAYVSKNGTTTYASTRIYVDTANKDCIIPVVGMFSLVKDDWLSMYVLQDTGVSQTLKAVNASPNFWMVRVG